MSAPDEPRPSQLPAHLMLGAAQVLFGIFPTAGKFVFQQVPPLGVASLRVVFGAATLFLAARAVSAPPVPDRRVLARIAVCAIFGIALNQMLFLEGLSRSTATHAGILVAAT